MTDVDPDELVNRVHLNLRVDESVVRKFEDAVIENWGHRQPYAAVELERELRHVLDSGEISRLWETVDSVLEAVGIPRGQKNSLKRHGRDSANTEVVGYRVNKDLRDRVIQFAEADDRSAGELVEDVMRRYYDPDGGSVVTRVADRLDRLTTLDDISDEKSATERRRDTIAAVVAGDDRTGFTLDDFDDAVDEHVRGLSASSHARDEHLEPVLDRIEYTWHPKNSEIFVPREEYDLPDSDDDRDPRGRPATLTNVEEMTVAVAAEVTERALEENQPHRLTLGEAASVIGKPDYNGLKTAFRRAAGRFQGLKPKQKDGSLALAARPDDVRGASDELHQHVDADTEADVEERAVEEEMKRVESAAPARAGETATETDTTGWVKDAAERYPSGAPEAVLNNCIVKAKHDGQPPTDDEGYIAQSELDGVTDRERELVRQRVASPSDGGDRAVADGGTEEANNE